MRFKGKITDGIGKHVELVVPGREDLESAPADWPVKLQPGSLNILVDTSGYPEAFVSMPLGCSVANLDDDCLPPVFQIPRDKMHNNKLTPTPESPRRGTGQVWRATLTTDMVKIDCWVLRRIGSGFVDKLELVSHEHLRNTYNLQNDQHVTVILIS